MTFERFAEIFPDDVAHLSAAQIACIWHLERHGYRFMIDFGYESAYDLAWGRYFLGIGMTS